MSKKKIRQRVIFDDLTLTSGIMLRVRAWNPYIPTSQRMGSSIKAFKPFQTCCIHLLHADNAAVPLASLDATHLKQADSDEWQGGAEFVSVLRALKATDADIQRVSIKCFEMMQDIARTPATTTERN